MIRPRSATDQGSFEQGVYAPRDGLGPDLSAEELTESTVDDEVWHRTDALDFIVVLDGGLTLERDDDVVDRHAGDCVAPRRGIMPGATAVTGR